jgi:hypothetical protein
MNQTLKKPPADGHTPILGWYVLVKSGSVVQLTLFGAPIYVASTASCRCCLRDRGGPGRKP